MYEIFTNDIQTKPIQVRPSGATFNHKVESLERFVTTKIPLWKRMMDIIVSLVMLVTLTPVWVIIYFGIKITSPGPVFFMQRRVGYLGKSFEMYKFRTMKLNASESTHKNQICDEIKNNRTLKKIDKDTRIFPFGKVLRQSCLDELPQLLNVIKGEMSLVGPRPELPYAVNEFKCWHCNRLNVAPGITGLWQVNGKNSTTFEQMIRYDIEYIRRRSIALDSKILLFTVPAIIKQVIEEKNC